MVLWQRGPDKVNNILKREKKLKDFVRLIVLLYDFVYKEMSQIVEEMDPNDTVAF